MFALFEASIRAFSMQKGQVHYIFHFVLEIPSSKWYYILFSFKKKSSTTFHFWNLEWIFLLFFFSLHPYSLYNDNTYFIVMFIIAWLLKYYSDSTRNFTCKSQKNRTHNFDICMNGKEYYPLLSICSFGKNMYMLVFKQ